MCMFCLYVRIMYVSIYLSIYLSIYVFMSVCLYPGVFSNSLCLFFAKLVAYAFIYWLPFYLQRNLGYSSVYAGNFSVIYDLGGVCACACVYLSIFYLSIQLSILSILSICTCFRSLVVYLLAGLPIV